MVKSIADRYRNALRLWTNWVTTRPKRVLALALALALGGLYFLSQNMAIDTSTGDMLSEDLDFRKFNRQMDDAFPQNSDTLLVVIDGQTMDLADAAARQLASEMRSRPQLFGEVYDLAGEPFFRRNGLLYLDLDDLYELSDRLADAQPFLATLWRDSSLNGLFGLLEKALTVEQDSAAVPFSIDPFLDRVRRIGEAQLAGRFAQLSWQDLMQGDEEETQAAETGAAGQTANRRYLLIQPALDFGTLHPASDAMDGVRRLVRELALTADNGLTVRLSGSAALEQEELESVEQGMGLAGLLSFVLVMVLLILALRDGWLVFSCLFTLLVGLIWTAAFAIAALGSLNLISVAFAVLFIGLSVDFGIHYALRYVEFRDARLAPPQALVTAAGNVGGALSLSAAGAAIAFYSFLPTDYNGLAELGLIAGTGMFIAFFANLTVLPALLALRSSAGVTPAQKSVPGQQGSRGLHNLIGNHRHAVIAGFLAAAVVAGFAVPQVQFDFDPLNLKNRQTESMSTLIDLMSDSRTSPYTIEVLSPDLDTGIALAAALDELDEVESAETIADYVPEDQAEKLDVIASMSLFLSPALNTEQSAEGAEVAPEQALERFIETLETSAASVTSDDLIQVLKAIQATPGGARDLERRLLIHAPAQLQRLKDSLQARPVTLENLPEALRKRKVSADGRVVVEVFPAADLSDRDRLITFVREVRAIAPRAIGSPVVILEAGQAILGAFFQAGVISVLLIACLLLLVLGNIRDVFLVFAPLVLAAVFTLAASALMGLAFNFANVIVLPLLFGLGVAGGIHLVIRSRAGPVSPDTSSSTPRAVLFSALTTMGSFGSIALSAHPGTASMGILLTISITLTLLCTLVFLPALLACFANSASPAH